MRNPYAYVHPCFQCPDILRKCFLKKKAETVFHKKNKKMKVYER